MRFNLFIAVIPFLFGLRLIYVAVKTALSGKVLVRQGFRTTWQPAPNHADALKTAFRDGLMGILLIVLAVALLI